MSSEYTANKIKQSIIDAQETKRKRMEFIDNLNRMTPNTNTTVASDNITFDRRHRVSMTDAIKQVFKDRRSHRDDLHLKPNNYGVR